MKTEKKILDLTVIFHKKIEKSIKKKNQLMKK